MSASVKRLDPVDLMDAVVRITLKETVCDKWWLKKVASLCGYAAALKKLLDIRTRQYRARCAGIVRDPKLEGELIAALNEVERIEAFFGLHGG